MEKLNKDNLEVYIQRLELLDMSHLGPAQVENKPDIEESEEDEEAVSFDARTHLAHFRRTVSFYAVYFNKWTFCPVTDNASTNIKISQLS